MEPVIKGPNGRIPGAEGGSHLLAELGILISSGTDLDHILTRACQMTTEVLASDSCDIALVEGASIVHRAGYGFASSRIQTVRPLGIGESLHGIVVKSGGPVRSTNLGEDPRCTTKEDAKRLGVVSYMGVPITVKNAVIGVLAVMCGEPRDFSSLEERTLAAMAGEIGIVIDNARLHEDERRRSAHLAIINDIGRIAQSTLDVEEILENVAEAIFIRFRHHYISLALVDEKRERVIHRTHKCAAPMEFSQDLSVAVGEGVVGSAVADGRTIVIRDTSLAENYIAAIPGIRSEICVPLKAGEEVIGALNVESRDADAFGESEIWLFETLGAQISGALMNAIYYGREKTRSRQLVFINEVSGTALRHESIQELLDDVVVLIQKYFVLADLSVFLVDKETNEVVQKAFAGSYRARTKEEYRQKIGEGIIGWVPKHGQTVLANDVTKDPRYIIVGLPRTLSELCVPIKVGDDVIGLLDAQSTSVGAFDVMDQATMETLADIVAKAIESIRLLEKERAMVGALKEADRVKSEFFANITHELRTPLNTIIGYSELMLDELYGDVTEKQKKALSEIAGKGRDLLGLINDLLDLARLDSGRVRVNAAELDYAALVREMTESVRPLTVRKGLKLSLDVGEGVGPMLSDEGKLRQILTNLLGNAVKFTEEGRIAVEVLRGGEWYVTRVSDTGIGIAPENTEVIFDEFRQADGSITRKYGGTGLGLSITRKLVTMLQGAIGVESELGVGSTFTFRLPVVHKDEWDAKAKDGADGTPDGDGPAEATEGGSASPVEDDAGGNEGGA